MIDQEKRKVGRPKSPETRSQRESRRQASKRASAARHALAMLPPGAIGYGKTVWSKSTGKKRVCKSNGPVEGKTYIYVETEGPCGTEPMEIVDISAYPPEHYDSQAVSERLTRMHAPDPGKSLINSPAAVHRAMELAASLGEKPIHRDYSKSRSAGCGMDIDANIRASMIRKYQERKAKREAGQTA